VTSRSDNSHPSRVQEVPCFASALVNSMDMTHSENPDNRFSSVKVQDTCLYGLLDYISNDSSYREMDGRVQPQCCSVLQLL